MDWYQDRAIIKFINDRPVFRQMVKFGLVGVFNTLVDLLAYIFFTRVIGWHYAVAATGAFVIAATFSFLINRYWTFRVSGNSIKTEYIKFVLVAFGGLLWTLLFLFILIDKFYWHDLVAKIFTVFLVVNWSFWLQKYWTFKAK
jgi:putative flippase GtrA